MVDIMGAHPSWVQFEERPMEDRDASLEAGHYIAKDVTYAIIRPVGGEGKLTVERIADEWLSSKREDPHYPDYMKSFEAYKKGLEPPEFGHALKDWPPITPGQLVNCENARIKTLEDLATAPDQAIAMIGMGGRQLQEKAAIYLESAENYGKVTEKISSLEVKVKELTEENKRLNEQLSSTQSAREMLRSIKTNESPKDS